MTPAMWNSNLRKKELTAGGIDIIADSSSFFAKCDVFLNIGSVGKGYGIIKISHCIHKLFWENIIWYWKKRSVKKACSEKPAPALNTIYYHVWIGILHKHKVIITLTLWVSFIKVLQVWRGSPSQGSSCVAMATMRLVDLSQLFHLSLSYLKHFVT